MLGYTDMMLVPVVNTDDWCRTWVLHETVTVVLILHYIKTQRKMIKMSSVIAMSDDAGPYVLIARINIS